jgi:hypothetical protein
VKLHQGFEAPAGSPHRSRAHRRSGGEWTVRAGACGIPRAD